MVTLKMQLNESKEQNKKQLDYSLFLIKSKELVELNPISGNAVVVYHDPDDNGSSSNGSGKYQANIYQDGELIYESVLLDEYNFRSKFKDATSSFSDLEHIERIHLEDRFTDPKDYDRLVEKALKHADYRVKKEVAKIIDQNEEELSQLSAEHSCLSDYQKAVEHTEKSLSRWDNKVTRINFSVSCVSILTVAITFFVGMEAKTNSDQRIGLGVLGGSSFLLACVTFYLMLHPDKLMAKLSIKGFDNNNTNALEVLTKHSLPLPTGEKLSYKDLETLGPKVKNVVAIIDGQLNMGIRKLSQAKYVQDKIVNTENLLDSLDGVCRNIVMEYLFVDPAYLDKDREKDPVFAKLYDSLNVEVRYGSMFGQKRNQPVAITICEETPEAEEKKPFIPGKAG